MIHITYALLRTKFTLKRVRQYEQKVAEIHQDSLDTYFFDTVKCLEGMRGFKNMH